ncbi:hypothetical protein ACO0SA_004118 [Hanseniaspora valbyensis]
MSTSNEISFPSNQFIKRTKSLLQHKGIDYHRKNSFSKDHGSAATLNGSAGLESFEEASILRQPSFQTTIRPTSRESFVSNNISIAKVNSVTRRISSPPLQFLQKSKNAFPSTVDKFNKLSSTTLVSSSPFSNGIVGRISSLPNHSQYRVSSNPFNIVDMITSLKNDVINEGTNQHDIYDIESPEIEDSELNHELSFASDSSFMCKNKSVLLENENNYSPLTNLLDLPVKIAPPVFKNSKINNEQSVNKKNIAEIMQQVKDEMLFKGETSHLYNTKLFKQDFDPRYGKTDGDSKLVEILNFEMGTPNNYVDTVTKDLENELAILKENMPYPSKMMQFFTKKTCNSVNENYFLLKEKIEMIYENPWCAFEIEFWKDLQNEKDTIEEQDLTEDTDSDIITFKKTNDKFNHFLNKEFVSHTMSNNDKNNNNLESIELSTLEAKVFV